MQFWPKYCTVLLGPHLTSCARRLQRDRGLGALDLHGEAAGQVQDAGQALALLRAEAGYAALLPGEPVLAGGGLQVVSQLHSVSRQQHVLSRGASKLLLCRVFVKDGAKLCW